MIQFDKFFDPKSTTKQFDNFFDQKMFVLNLVLWQSILTENMNFLIFQYFWTIQSKFFKSFQRNETQKNQNATVLHFLTVDNLNLARKNVKILWLKNLVKFFTKVLRSPSAGNSSNSSSSSKRPRSTAFFSELIVKEIVVLVLEFTSSNLEWLLFFSLQLLFSVNFYAWSGLPDNFAALRRKY